MKKNDYIKMSDGDFHATYEVLDLSNYGVTSSVSESLSSESVYVTYRHGLSTITCRFSWHDNNAVLFGDQLNGYLASEGEILYRLGLAKMHKEPVYATAKRIYRYTQCLGAEKRANMAVCPFTEKELLELPVGTSLEQYKGMACKCGEHWCELRGGEIFEHQYILMYKNVYEY